MGVLDTVGVWDPMGVSDPEGFSGSEGVSDPVDVSYFLGVLHHRVPSGRLEARGRVGPNGRL